MVPRSPDDLVMEMELELSRRPFLAFLLVEGPDDARFWRSRTRSTEWEYIVATGKRNVVDTVSHRSRTPPALGIVDADYDHLDNVPCPSDVCRTDVHDLEAMFISSGALERVLHEHGSADKITAYEQAEGSVRNQIAAMGGHLARLRRANHDHRWGLKFKKKNSSGLDRIPYQKFVDKKTWKLDPAAMVTAVLNYNSRHDLPTATVQAEMAALAAPANPWHWLNGHDLAAILALGLSHVLGSDNRSSAEIERALRLAHERAELAATDLGRAIRVWETRVQRLLLDF